MSRPSLNPINSSSSGWLAILNSNFEKIFDKPFPMDLHATSSALTTAANPKLYEDCFALVGPTGASKLYKSDGVSWNEHRPMLVYIADLNPATATVSDIKDAYNTLIGDMQTKGWML